MRRTAIERMRCTDRDQEHERDHEASVHDQRKRKRPPTTTAASASPNTIKTTNTQYNPAPAPSSDPARWARTPSPSSRPPSAPARSGASARPGKSPSPRRRHVRVQSDERARAGSRSDRSAGLGWQRDRQVSRLVWPFACSERLAREFQNGHNPQQTTGSEPAQRTPPSRRAGAGAMLPNRPPGSPDQSSRPPGAASSRAATSRCEKWRRSPTNGLRPSRQADQDDRDHVIKRHRHDQERRQHAIRRINLAAVRRA